MSLINGLSIYLYKLLVLFLMFPIGGMLTSGMFGNNIVGSFFFAGCLLLLSIMKFNKFLGDPDFDFNTFVLVILIIPIVIDYLFKVTYMNFYFFSDMEFTYDVLFNYIQIFYEDYLQKIFSDLALLDSGIKEFYLVSLTLFIMIKYFISQVLNYLYLDYLLITIFIFKILFK